MLLPSSTPQKDATKLAAQKLNNFNNLFQRCRCSSYNLQSAGPSWQQLDLYPTSFPLPEKYCRIIHCRVGRLIGSRLTIYRKMAYITYFFYFFSLPIFPKVFSEKHCKASLIMFHIPHYSGVIPYKSNETIFFWIFDQKSLQFLMFQ